MELVNQNDKPKCRLPDIMISSSIIGSTVKALRKAKKDDDLKSFLTTIKNPDNTSDYFSIVKAAEKYVEFYE